MVLKNIFIITFLSLFLLWNRTEACVQNFNELLDVSIGTKILMSNGSEKKIEDVKLSDSVICLDTLTHRLFRAEITSTGNYSTCGIKAIGFANGITNESTADQPYYVYHKGWSSVDTAETNKNYGIKVNLLTKGDTVYNYSNGHLGYTTITNITNVPETEYPKRIDLRHLGVRAGGNYFANGILIRAEGKTYHFPPYSKIPHKVLIKIHLTVNNHVQNNKITAFNLSDSLGNIQPTTYMERDTSKEYKTDSSYQSILNLKDSNSLPFQVSFAYKNFSFTFPLEVNDVHLVSEIDYYIDIGKIESTKERGVFLCHYVYSKERLYGKYEGILGDDPVGGEVGKIKCYKK